MKPTLHVSNNRRAVYAMVLAAGQSRRMGRLKQLLPYKQATILDSVLEAVLESSVDGLVVVTNPFLVGHLQGRLPEEHCLLVENADSASEMLASMQLGLTGALQEFDLADDDGIMVLLADQPQITAGVITTCAERFRLPAHPPGIMVATYKGKRGHPAIFRVDLLQETSSWGPNRRLNELAKEHPAEVRELPITMAPMPLDVNTPQDYDRLMGRS